MSFKQIKDTSNLSSHQGICLGVISNRALPGRLPMGTETGVEQLLETKTVAVLKLLQQFMGKMLTLTTVLYNSIAVKCNLNLSCLFKIQSELI